MVPWNSASEGFAYNDLAIDKVSRNGRYKQIHFLSDVLVALASLDLKVPNRRDTR